MQANKPAEMTLFLRSASVSVTPTAPNAKPPNQSVRHGKRGHCRRLGRQLHLPLAMRAGWIEAKP